MTFSNEEQRKKWIDILKADFMSSEESDVDNGDEVLVVRSLPWRSSQVNQLFQRLDDVRLLEKKPLALRQTKRRVVGAPSNCPIPCGNVPAWVVAETIVHHSYHETGILCFHVYTWIMI